LQGKETEYFLSGFPNASEPKLIQSSESQDILLSLESVSSHAVSILVQINADQIKMERNR